jgi:hypothetical protein
MAFPKKGKASMRHPPINPEASVTEHQTQVLTCRKETPFPTQFARFFHEEWERVNVPHAMLFPHFAMLWDIAKDTQYSMSGSYPNR